jgi:hypothetical protein
MKIGWRFLVLMAFAFWQGGFLFYASVVVPVGQEELSSPLDQGFITRRVTNYLNLSGAVALLFLGADVAVGDKSRQRRLLRTVLWLSLAGSLGGLAWLHLRMDAQLDLVARSVIDEAAFRVNHRVYLWVSTVQWALGLVCLVLMLAAWRDGDQQQHTNKEVEIN